MSRRQSRPLDDRPRKIYICRPKCCNLPCIRECAEPPEGCPHWPGIDNLAVWYELVPVKQGATP